jgi:hypothetical protein
MEAGLGSRADPRFPWGMEPFLEASHAHLLPQVLIKHQHSIYEQNLTAEPVIIDGLVTIV